MIWVSPLTITKVLLEIKKKIRKLQLKHVYKLVRINLDKTIIHIIFNNKKNNFFIFIFLI